MQNDTAAKILKLIGYLASIPLSIYLGGLAVQYLWQWFIAEMFHMPLLGFAQALGLSLFVNYFTKQSEYYVDKEGADNLRVFVGVAKPLAVLLTGWVIHSYM